MGFFAALADRGISDRAMSIDLRDELVDREMASKFAARTASNFQRATIASHRPILEGRLPHCHRFESGPSYR